MALNFTFILLVSFANFSAEMFSTKFLLLSSVSTGALASATLAAVSKLPVVSLSEGASCACSQLMTQYGPEVLGVNSTSYTAEATNYWDVRANLSPSCIFLPTDADQVANAVAIISSCGAQFAIRGGGHMNVLFKPAQNY